METINYAECQNYLSRQVALLNSIGTITNIEWGAGCDAIFDDELPDPPHVNISVFDENGMHIIYLHNPMMHINYFEVDNIIINILLHRVFEQHGIHCPFSYVLDLNSIDGLLNDARALFRMKNSGEDLSGFEFTYYRSNLHKKKWMKVIL